MATLSTSVRVVMGAPSLRHEDGVLTVAVPILNAGDVTLEALACTDIGLGTAARISPPVFPLHLGAVGPRNTVTALGKFTGAVPGTQLMVRIRGTYRVQGVEYGLSLSRFVVVPPSTGPVLPTLRAKVRATTAHATWDYTIVNEEPAGSRQHVASFSLQVAAPVTVTGTPPGWRAETDNATYVLWVSEDATPPYASHVAPGRSLAGFQLTSPRTGSEAGPYSLVAWNHAVDDAGLVVAEYTLTPRR